MNSSKNILKLTIKFLDEEHESAVLLDSFDLSPELTDEYLNTMLYALSFKMREAQCKQFGHSNLIPGGELSKSKICVRCREFV